MEVLKQLHYIINKIIIQWLTCLSQLFSNSFLKNLHRQIQQIQNVFTTNILLSERKGKVLRDGQELNYGKTNDTNTFSQIIFVYESYSAHVYPEEHPGFSNITCVSHVLSYNVQKKFASLQSLQESEMHICFQDTYVGCHNQSMSTGKATHKHRKITYLFV